MLLGLSVLFLAIHLYFISRELLAPVLGLPREPTSLQINTIVLMLFSLCHASYMLGARKALAFFLISAVVSWAFEQVGVATGLVYGAYHYTDKLGMKIGHVPVLIPIAWFMMIYPSYVIANLIIDGRPTSARAGIRHVVWLSLLSGIIMTAWDLPMDPLMSGMKHWIWDEGGPYFGVPIQNFVGWLLTTFTVYLLYGLLEQWHPARRADGASAPVAAMPVIAYGAFATFHVFRSDPVALGLIAFFAMGLPTLLAAAQLSRLRPQSRATMNQP
jgi:putative membrane protein